MAMMAVEKPDRLMKVSSARADPYLLHVAPRSFRWEATQYLFTAWVSVRSSAFPAGLPHADVPLRSLQP